MSTVMLASLQMVSTPRLQDNLDTVARLIKQAACQGAQVVLLPEYFCLMGQRDTDKLDIQEPFGEGPIQAFLASQAQEHGLFVIAGTLPIVSNVPGKVYNSCLVYSPEGQCIARYDKIHLFCFKQGSESYDEGKTLLAGHTPVVVQLLGLKVGLSVCYDLRFPELYRAMGEVDLVVMPAAFTYTTGQAHWSLLNRTRAVENQCYVLACGQGGHHENGRRTYGHSMLIDPWGHVCNVLEEGEGVLLGALDTAKINGVRTSLPALTHKKAFLS